MHEEEARKMSAVPFEGINTIDWAITCLKAFLDVTMNIKVEKIDLEETVFEQDNQIQQFIKELKVIRESKWHQEINFNTQMLK